jgi:hypothetical protein
MKRRSAVLLAITVTLSIALAADAQVRMPQGVFGNGGGLTGDASHAIQGTLGQLVLGVATGPQTVCQNGFWFSPLLFCSGVDQPEPAPGAFWLSPAQPNPFRQVTALAYAIPMRCRVTIRLFDVSGRETTTLVDKEQEAGSYSALLTGARLSSGVYFCRMAADRFVKTERLVLIR